MATAVQVYQLPPARPRCAPPSVAPARPVLWQQPGFLQRRLDVRVRQRDPVLTARDLVEVPRVEARILLAIKLQEALDFGERRPPRRGPTAPTVEQAKVAITRKAPPPAPQTARRTADDLRRL